MPWPATHGCVQLLAARCCKAAGDAPEGGGVHSHPVGVAQQRHLGDELLGIWMLHRGRSAGRFRDWRKHNGSSAAVVRNCPAAKTPDAAGAAGSGGRYGPMRRHFHTLEYVSMPLAAIAAGTARRSSAATAARRPDRVMAVSVELLVLGVLGCGAVVLNVNCSSQHHFHCRESGHIACASLAQSMRLKNNSRSGGTRLER